MADIFREIDEDLRRDRVEKLWQRYGGILLAGAVAVIAATGGYVAWDQWRTTQRADATQRLVAALTLAEQGGAEQGGAEQGGGTAAIDALQTFAAGAPTGPGTLARLYEAGLRAQAGDTQAAVTLYDRVAADGAAEPVYRNLATLLAVMHQVGKGDPVPLQARLTPLIGDDNPWRHSARELMGLLAVQTGDVERAKVLFQQLAQDAGAPAGVRGRAADLAARYGATPSANVQDGRS